MAYDYHYTYICAPSSESRGRRVGHDGGCLRMNYMSRRHEICGDEKPQASPCPFCNKRNRLNEGIVTLWFDLRDAIHHATEYNRANFDSMPDLATEQTPEQTPEETGEYDE